MKFGRLVLSVLVCTQLISTGAVAETEPSRTRLEAEAFKVCPAGYLKAAVGSGLIGGTRATDGIFLVPIAMPLAALIVGEDYWETAKNSVHYTKAYIEVGDEEARSLRDAALKPCEEAMQRLIAAVKKEAEQKESRTQANAQQKKLPAVPAPLAPPNGNMPVVSSARELN